MSDRAGKCRRDRTDRAHPPVSAVAPHAGLLDVDDVGPDRFHHVIAEPEPFEHAGRKALGDDVADAHQVLCDLEALGMTDIEREAALAGVLVVELAAHVGILDAGQRRRRAHARFASADRRHRRKPRIGILLPFDFQAFGTERREKARAAGRSEKPGKIENADVLKRERLAARGQLRRGRRLARTGRNADRVRRPTRRHVRRRTARAGPACQLVAVLSHLLVGIAEAAPELRMLHIRQSFRAPANADRARSHAACGPAPKAGRPPGLRSRERCRRYAHARTAGSRPEYGPGARRRTTSRECCAP